MGDPIKFSFGTVVDEDGDLYIRGVEITATAAEINAACDLSTANYIAVPDGTTYTVLAANSRKVHLLPDMTAACTITLPTEVDGLEFEFEYIGGAEDAHGIIIDNTSDTNFFVGGVNHLDADGETQLAVFSDGDSNSIFTATTITAGTRIKLICNGTSWYISGLVNGATAPTFADQS